MFDYILLQNKIPKQNQNPLTSGEFADALSLFVFVNVIAIETLAEEIQK